MKTALGRVISGIVIGGAFSSLSCAQVVVQDTLTGTSSSYAWQAFNGACLTAGDGSVSTIPACKGLAYYSNQTLFGGYNGTFPDPSGNGALRFTNADGNNGSSIYHSQNGAIVSTVPFSSSAGIQVTFTTVTYFGDAGGSGGDGADGMSFYLLDASKSASIGSWGGSLGYSCSNANPPYDGVVGGYLGLGIDEYGNFLNQSDNTAAGYGYQPGRIGLRGAGNIAWRWLNSTYPTNYPSSLSSSQRQAAVQNTCKTGNVWNYSNPNSPSKTATTVMDYAPITNAYSILPSSNPIANEAAQFRGSAVPISYKLNITQDGLLSLSYSYNGGIPQPVITKQSISASNGPLPANFLFGFAGSTGGSNNIHEITCFQASQADVSSSSASVNVQQSDRINTGTQVYLAYYNPNNWTGELTSQNLVYNTTTNVVSISSTVNWDASCVLTGGLCAATGSTLTAENPTSRALMSWNGTKGIPFEWSSLTASQQATLDQGDTAPINANRLNFLRGDRSNEITTSGSGLYRARASVLGDIINSTPTWVGPPSDPYAVNWADNLYQSASMAENSGQTYAQFTTSYASRLNVVYAGANDGFLHGFRSGSYDASGNYVTSSTPNDGLEVFGYMPNAVLQTIHNSTTPGLDYANTQYAHNYYVDGTPAADDLFYAGAWHSWLVGGLGAGGSAIYALDVTDPSTFSESNASSLVKGEWTPSTITCANVTNCGNNLGSTYGTPVIRRLHNGNWAALFGNGYNSANGRAGIYVMSVDSSSGAITFYFLDTGYGPSRDPLGNSRANGIYFVSPADLDGDHITDYVYAGDVFGNLWRFDLTSNTPSQWTASSSPLFSTPGGQPITTKVMVAASNETVGLPRIVLDFGTGQVFPQTITAAASYASGTQAFYGIWDWNMSGWNSLNSIQYASLAAPQSISSANLQSQSILSTINGGGLPLRTVSQNTVCWKGLTTCTGGNTQLGWVLPLPVSGTNAEQVIYSPILSFGAFIVNTTVPAVNSPITCGNASVSGWTMAVDPGTGGAFKNSFFGSANNNTFVSYNGQVVSGIGLNAVGSPSVVIANKTPNLVTQTVSGVGSVNAINPPTGTKSHRLIWLQKR